MQTFTHRAQSMDHITKTDCSLASHPPLFHWPISNQMGFLKEENLRGRVVMHRISNCASQADANKPNECVCVSSKFLPLFLCI